MSSNEQNQGWNLLRSLNKGIGVLSSVDLRRMLASYMATFPMSPSRLHSAILAVAVKMATRYSDFHFVPFLDAWGLENLRSDDSETDVDASGKRYPSLVERLAKAYVYSLLFHPDERLAVELEATLVPLIQQKGFSLSHLSVPMIATTIFTSEVRGRNIRFVRLVAADGTEVTTDFRTLTAFSRMPHTAIPNSLFRVLLRTDRADSDKIVYRVEAALLESCSVADCFPTSVGYVTHIDYAHHHIHVIDNQSRHFVSEHSLICPAIGQYVEFTPIVPLHHKFKSAIINKVYALPDGSLQFGYRQARITRVNADPLYGVWELTGGSAIVEAGTTEPSYTMGYLSEQLLQAKQFVPKVGSVVELIVFLKRGKDGVKRPYVVDIK